MYEHADDVNRSAAQRKSLAEDIDAVELTLCSNIKFQSENPVKKTTKEIALRILCTNWFPTVLIFPLTICTLPFYLLSSFLFCLPKPPQYSGCYTILCVRFWRICFYQRYARPFRLWERITLFFCWLNELLWYPIYGLMWNIDEIFYDYRRQSEGDRPIILIQCARVGSTSFGVQLFDLVQDEYIPIDVLLLFFPFLWMHKCLFPCCGWTRKQIHDTLGTLQPEEFHQRHISRLNYPDTFEIIYQMVHRGGVTTNWHTGFREWIRIFANGQSDESELECFRSYMKKAKYLWDLDGIKNVFIKCHSIEFGEQLAKMYPNAKFVNMIRTGDRVLESLTNFWLISAPDPIFGGDVWVENTQVCAALYLIVYRELEKEFYSKDAKHRITFSYTDWTQRMEHVLKSAVLFLGLEYNDKRKNRVQAILSEEKKRAPRKYTIDFKLDEIWIDVDVVRRLVEVGFYVSNRGTAADTGSVEISTELPEHFKPFGWE